MPKCRKTPEHCRKIKSGGRAKSPCTRDGALGTRVRMHYSPKHCYVPRLQAAVRGKLARIKYSRSKSPSAVPFADSIKAGHAKVRVGEKFKTASGTYVKTASKPSGYRKV